MYRNILLFLGCTACIITVWVSLWAQTAAQAEEKPLLTMQPASNAELATLENEPIKPTALSESTEPLLTPAMVASTEPEHVQLEQIQPGQMQPELEQTQLELTQPEQAQLGQPEAVMPEKTSQTLEESLGLTPITTGTTVIPRKPAALLRQGFEGQVEPKVTSVVPVQPTATAQELASAVSEDETCSGLCKKICLQLKEERLKKLESESPASAVTLPMVQENT